MAALDFATGRWRADDARAALADAPFAAGFAPGLAADFATGFADALATGFAASLATDLATDFATGFAADFAADLTTGFETGLAAGFAADLATGFAEGFRVAAALAADADVATGFALVTGVALAGGFTLASAFGVGLATAFAFPEGLALATGFGTGLAVTVFGAALDVATTGFGFAVGAALGLAAAGCGFAAGVAAGAGLGSWSRLGRSCRCGLCRNRGDWSRGLCRGHGGRAVATVNRWPRAAIRHANGLDHRQPEFGRALGGLRCLQAREGDDLLELGMPVEPDDRRLAENRLDDSLGTDRVVADRRAGARPRVRDQGDVLANTKGWRRLLTSPRGPAGCRRRTRRDSHDDGHDGRSRRLFLLVVVVLVVIDDRDDSDLDIDLLSVVQFDGITLQRLCGRCLGLVRFGVDGGIDRFCRHSGSYVTDG